MQSMHNDNTTVVLACLCVHPLSLFSSSVFAFSFQGLAHLKAEQGTLFSVALYFFLPFFAVFIGLVLGHLHLCTWQVVRVHLCADGVMIPLLPWNSKMVCVCVCVRVCCVGRMHEADACSSFCIPPPHASASLCPCFTQAFLALHNCVGVLFLQLRCSDTLHCSCLTFVASGKGKLGWQGWKINAEGEMMGIKEGRNMFTYSMHMFHT